MKITYRQVKSFDDREVVRNMVSRIWPECYHDILSNAQIEYMLDMMYSEEAMCRDISNGTEFWICSADGIPVGFVSYSSNPNPNGVIELHKIYLFPEFRNRGVGGKILRHICGKAGKSGADFVELRVNKHNDKAIGAYLKAGFVKKSDIVSDIGGGFVMDDYVMQKVVK